MAVQAAAPSSFPIVPLAVPADAYDAIVDTARSEYVKYANYSAKSAEVEGKVKEWTDRHSALKDKKVEPAPDLETLKTEFWEKVGAYVVYQFVRDDTLRIIGLYNQAINSCQPPALDIQTLVVLQNLKIKISDVQASYDKTFTTDLNQLVDQREKMQALYDQIVPPLKLMRFALEPLGKLIYAQDQTWGPKHVGSYLERTPFVNWGCVTKKAENALAQAPVQQPPAQQPVVQQQQPVVQQQVQQPPAQQPVVHQPQPPAGPPPGKTFAQVLGTKAPTT